MLVLRDGLAVALVMAALVSDCAIRSATPAFPGAAYCGSVEKCNAACEGNDPTACGFMSQAALAGAGVPKSAPSFVAYATRGCQAHDGRSCAQLAFGYFAGVGLPRDWEKAAEYNDRACHEGFAIGCRSLGLAYREGHGVVADPAYANTLFGQSCDGGAALGCVSLAQGMPDGMIPDDRAAKALPLLVHDCDPEVSPDLHACTVAAKMYAVGRGAPVDAAQARALYIKACKRGDTAACDQSAR